MEEWRSREGEIRLLHLLDLLHSFESEASMYEKLGGAIPVLYAPGLERRAGEARRHLDAGFAALSDIFDVAEPGRDVACYVSTMRIEAVIVADNDWRSAPRENERPYPPGLPYFTRSTEPPTLVLPEELSPAIRPRTGATLPLTVWHELAHAFFLRRPVVKTPAWLREFVPQTASATVAKREELSLEEHLARIEHPGFAVREFTGAATAKEQMAFQNLLLSLGDAAVEQFGEDFLKRLVHALWNETEIVDEKRAEELLDAALGPGGREWLEARSEF
ncbi:MAG: hypothetical protein ACRDSJ_11035 [Rubrobacteraceae bacterium]